MIFYDLEYELISKYLKKWIDKGQNVIWYTHNPWVWEEFHSDKNKSDFCTYSGNLKRTTLKDYIHGDEKQKAREVSTGYSG